MSYKAVLTGGLAFISLADIIQLLGENNSTGILRLTSKYAPKPGYIYFKEGEIVNASTADLTGLNAVHALFGWMEGQFEFQEGGVRVDNVVQKKRMQVVLDSLRLLDEGKIKQIGPFSSEEKAHAKRKAGQGQGDDASFEVIQGPLPDLAYVVKEEIFSDGEEIVAEGSHGNWIWVILDGSVKVSKNTSKGHTVIARLGEGSFIGTVASLVQGGYVRTATVSAVGETILGVLDIQRLIDEYSRLSPEFNSLFLSLVRRLNRVTEKAVGPLQKIDCLTRPKDIGNLIIQKGSHTQDAYLINEGSGYVVGQTPKGPIPLLPLGKKDVFGSLPFVEIGHEPQQASVLASGDLKLTKLNTDKLQEEFDHLSRTFKNLLINVCTCVSVTTQLALREAA